MTAAEPSRGRGGGLRPLLYAAVLCFTASEAALHLLVPVLLAVELDVPVGAIGLIVAAFGIAALAARVPVGLLYRRERAARIVLVGGLFASASYALIPIVADPLATAVLLAIDGAGWAAATTVLMAAVAEDDGHRGSSSGTIGWYMGFVGLGNAATGLAGILAAGVGVQNALLVLAVLPALATPAAALVLRSTAPSVIGVPPVATQIGTTGWFAEIRSLPAGVWAGVVVMVNINAVNGLVNTLHPVLALRAGLSIVEIGILSSMRSLASSWTRIASAPFFGRLPVARMTTPLVVVGALAIALLPVVAWSFWLQVPIFIAAGVSRGFLRVSASAMAFDDARSESRSLGLTSAVVQGGLDVGRLLGPFVGGLAAAWLTLPAAFVAVPILFVGMYVVTWLRRRTVRARRPVGESISPS